MINMDWTAAQHGIITLLCCLVGLYFDQPIAGAAFGTALFIGREHAQSEYRWIEKYGNSKRSNMPWYGGFDYVVWDIYSLLDLLAPTIVAVVFVWMCNYW
jgi:hypothetical protein